MDEKGTEAILRHVKAEEVGETLKVELSQAVHIKIKIWTLLFSSALQYFPWKETPNFQYSLFSK